MKNILSRVLFLCMLFCIIFNHSVKADRLDVKVGIFDFKSFFDVSESGERYGYGYEYLQNISRFNNVNFQYVYGTYAECQRMLQDGRIDILCGVNTDEDVNGELLFSKYAMGVAYVKMFVRAGSDIGYNDFKAIDGLRVGMISESGANELYLDYANANGFSTQNTFYPSTQSLENALAVGEIDASVTSGLRESRYETPVLRFSPTNFYIATHKDRPDLKKLIDNAMEQIIIENPNFNAELRRKYYPSDFTTLILTKEEREYIESNKEITVVANSYHAPFESFNAENDVIDGINADILKLIESKTGFKFKFITGYDYEQCVEAVGTGKADMLLSHDTNHQKAWQNNMILSETYLSTPIAIYGRSDEIKSSSVFAVSQSNSIVSDYIKTRFPSNIITYYKDINECYDAVISQKADFLLENVYSAGQKLSDLRYTEVSVIRFTSLLDRYSFAVRSDMSPVFLNILNKSINSITNDEIEQILFSHTIAAKRNIHWLSFISRYRVSFVFGAVLMFMFLSICLLAVIITQRNSRRKLWEAAYIDPMTKLSNFSKFRMDATRLLETNINHKYAMIKVDIDRFKFINDMCGYEAGSNLLKAVAKSLEHCINKETDACARIYSDEFVVLKAYDTNEDIIATRIAFLNHFNNIFKEPLVTVKFTLGRYKIERGETGFNEIYEKANLAHRTAKIHPDMSICDYDESVRKNAVHRREVESLMEEALKNEEFVVFLQPKVYTGDECLAGAEALIRWKDSSGKDLIYPNSFIPIFEENGFIVKLDMYVFERVCRIIKGWMENGLEPVPVSVNFSRLHLSSPDFVDKLCEIAKQYDVPKELLELELTETAIFDNEDLLISVLDNLHKAGFRLSMDDFGTGYSSLGLLKNLKVDVLKIDRSFFINSENVNRTRTVIAHVINMAKDLGMETVAEGVELVEHVNLLKEMGCDIVQGYYFSRPIPADDFVNKLS